MIVTPGYGQILVVPDHAANRARLDTLRPSRSRANRQHEEHHRNVASHDSSPWRAPRVNVQPVHETCATLAAHGSGVTGDAPHKKKQAEFVGPPFSVYPAVMV